MSYRRTIRKEQARAQEGRDKLAACRRAWNVARVENDAEHVKQLGEQMDRYRLSILANERNIRELEAGHFPPSLMDW